MVKIIPFFILLCIIFFSCIEKKRTQVSIYEITIEELIESSVNTTDKDFIDTNNKYTFNYYEQRDEYWDMNDISYFIKHQPTVRSLRLIGGTFTDITPLTQLNYLEELEITLNNYITDISPIASLVNLKKLTLGLDYLESIESLSSLINLNYLCLYYNDSYYKELVPLQNIDILKLYGNKDGGIDVCYISELLTLRELSITPKGFIHNIEKLSNLNNLEELTILGVVDIDLSWVIKLQKLRTIAINNGNIDNIRPLLELPNLIKVDLSYSEVNDIMPLLESNSIKIITCKWQEGIQYSLFEEKGIQINFSYTDR